jgi:copper transport protein
MGGARRRVLTAVAVICLFAAAGVRPAWAHALLERGIPGPEQVVQEAPRRVHLYFSEDLNSSASEIIVWNRFRKVETRGDARLVPGQPRQLEVGLKALAPGAYLVLWTSASAADGHVLHGVYLFYVQKRGPGPSLAGVATGGTSQTFPDGAGLTSIVAHWLELLAAVGWVGPEAFFLLVLTPLGPRLAGAAREREERRRRRLVRTSLVTLVVSSSTVMLMLAYGLAGTWNGVLKSATWSELLDADYGRLWVARQGIALLALVLTLAARARPAVSPSLAAAAAPIPRASQGRLIGMGLAAIYLYLVAASGHAASVNVAQVAGSRLVSGAVVVDWLHYIADALWLGGQIYIAVALIPVLGIARVSPSEIVSSTSVRSFLVLLSRFSPLAYLSVALFTLTGVFNATVHVPTLYAFLNTIYGKTLIIKILLVGAMMGISALTVYVIRPRIRRALPAGPNDEPVLGAMLQTLAVFLADLGQRGLPIQPARRATSGPSRVPRTVHSRDQDFTLESMLRALVFFLRLNPVLGAGVLLATSILFFYPVPFASLPGPTSYTVQGSRVTAVASITPNYAGVNQMRVVLTDAGGHPIRQAYVNVSSTMLDMQVGPNGMGMGVDPLPEVRPGVFAGPVQLLMGGRWHLTLLVYRPSGVIRLGIDVRVGL